MTADELARTLNRANDHLTGAEYFAACGEWLRTLEAIHTVHLALIEATTEAAQEAFNDGATKTAIARALAVPPSTFRGMTKTRLP